ncbi:MAG: hypothetical protein IPI49_18710 [Myxococcales bacterium]|nr:hypothetical protein [Myxococcales bacterium]
MSTIQQAGAILCLALAAASSGCKGKKESTTPKDAATDASIPKVDPTLCETEGKNVLTYDLNKDTRPDVWRLFKSEDEGGTAVEYMTCKQVDFDHDGRKDWVVGYNRKGTVVYEKADFDYDGKFDMSSLFDPKKGTVLEIERDRDFDGKYDLKEIYDSSGQLVGPTRPQRRWRAGSLGAVQEHHPHRDPLRRRLRQEGRPTRGDPGRSPQGGDADRA